MENGGNHPLGSVAQLYISRKNGGRRLRSVEAEYISTKIKAAVKIFENSDTTPGFETNGCPVARGM